MTFEVQTIRVLPYELAWLHQSPPPDELWAFLLAYAPQDKPMPCDRLDVVPGKTLCLSRFTLALLTEWEPNGTPIKRAIMAGSRPFSTSVDGVGLLGYNTVEDVQALLEALQSLPDNAFDARFYADAQGFLYAARYGGLAYLQTEQLMLDYQRAQFKRIVQFYEQAAAQGEATVLVYR